MRLSRKRRVLLLLVFAVVLATSAVVASYVYYSVYGHAKTCTNGPTVYYTIVESDTGQFEGMNGSAIKGVNAIWPVIQVTQGDTVVIHVVNQNSSEPHGFAVDHYFSSGVSLAPGESYDVRFVADVTGIFRMYCSVFCAIHPLMQNGQLKVVSC